MAEKKAVTFIVNHVGEHIFCTIWEIIVSVSSWGHIFDVVARFLAHPSAQVRLCFCNAHKNQPVEYTAIMPSGLYLQFNVSHQDHMRLWIQRCTFYPACKRVQSTLLINPYDVGSYFSPNAVDRNSNSIRRFLIISL